MTVQFHTTSSPPYYDRNPGHADLGVYSVVAPHAETTRDTYTVPAGKKAIIQADRLTVRRLTVATTPGQFNCVLALTTSAYTDIHIVRAGLEATANAVHDRLIQYLETPIVLLAGDVAEIITNDASTGGTVEFIAQFVIMEFDQ